MDGLKTIFQNITSGRKTMTFTDSAITNNSVIEVYPDSSLDIIPVSISINGHSCTVTFDKNASATKSVCLLINNIVGEFSPGGGADVAVTAYYETGDHIADITIDDETTEIYAPGASFSGDAYDIKWNDFEFEEETVTYSVGQGLDMIVDEIGAQTEYIETRIPISLIDDGVLTTNYGTNTWKKLDSTDIQYDNDTTVYDRISSLEDLVPDDPENGTYLFHGSLGNYWRKPTASNIDYDDNSTIYSIIGDIDDITTTSKNLVGAINEIKSSGGGVIYSTDEYDTGKIWIDGKKIYGKVFVTTGLPNVNIPFEETNFDRIISLTGGTDATVTGQGYFFRPLPMVDSNPANNLRMDYTTGNIRILGTGVWGDYTVYVIIEYTK